MVRALLGRVTVIGLKHNDRILAQTVLIEAGDQLAVVEAMKMENMLRAERDATVKAVNFAAGESLAVDEVIIEFE